jgi:hypothetical protein
MNFIWQEKADHCLHFQSKHKIPHSQCARMNENKDLALEMCVKMYVIMES